MAQLGRPRKAEALKIIGKGTFEGLAFPTVLLAAVQYKIEDVLKERNINPSDVTPKHQEQAARLIKRKLEIEEVPLAYI